MEWISVKDRLPIREKESLSIHVLIKDEDAGIFPFIGWYDPSIRGGGFYTHKNEGTRCVRVICTHFIEISSIKLEDPLPLNKTRVSELAQEKKERKDNTEFDN